MRLLFYFSVILFSSSRLLGQDNKPSEPCRESVTLGEKCFKIDGALGGYNGTPTFRIATKTERYGVVAYKGDNNENPGFPENIERLLKKTKLLDSGELVCGRFELIHLPPLPHISAFTKAYSAQRGGGMGGGCLFSFPFWRQHYSLAGFTLPLSHHITIFSHASRMAASLLFHILLVNLYFCDQPYSNEEISIDSFSTDTSHEVQISSFLLACHNLSMLWASLTVKSENVPSESSFHNDTHRTCPRVTLLVTLSLMSTLE